MIFIGVIPITNHASSMSKVGTDKPGDVEGSIVPEQPPLEPQPPVEEPQPVIEKINKATITMRDGLILNQSNVNSESIIAGLQAQANVITTTLVDGVETNTTTSPATLVINTPVTNQLGVKQVAVDCQEVKLDQPQMATLNIVSDDFRISQDQQLAMHVGQQELSLTQAQAQELNGNSTQLVSLAQVQGVNVKNDQLTIKPMQSSNLDALLKGVPGAYKIDFGIVNPPQRDAETKSDPFLVSATFNVSDDGIVNLPEADFTGSATQEELATEYGNDKLISTTSQPQPVNTGVSSNMMLLLGGMLLPAMWLVSRRYG